MSTKDLAVLSQDIEKVLMHGDLSPLSPSQRVQYHNNVCKTMGLNPATKPFEYMTFRGKTVLYATKNCAEQLRKIYRISLRIVERKMEDGNYCVTVRASTPDGREDEDFAEIPVGSLRGENLANAKMKCTTKAKRRATLSICGLGMLDESEVESIERTEKDVTPTTVEDLAQIEQDEDLMIPGGKYDGRNVSDLSIDECMDLAESWEERAAIQEIELKGIFKDIVDACRRRIESDQAS